MSTETLFYYRRISQDKEGRLIVSDIWDCFHVHRIVRGVWASEEVFSVRLDDGHEEARDAERKVGAKGKVQIVKERAWYVSQVEMCREDALRLQAATEITIGMEELSTKL
jgi:hypothetical protein